MVPVWALVSTSAITSVIVVILVAVESRPSLPPATTDAAAPTKRRRSRLRIRASNLRRPFLPANWTMENEAQPDVLSEWARGCAREERSRSLARKEALMASNETPSIVLVHGGFVDGSGWEGVYKILKEDSHDVSIVQNSRAHRRSHATKLC